MRNTTKRKVWGRGTVVQCLRAAAEKLNNALAVVSEGEPPGTAELREVLKDLNRSLEYYDIYKIGRPRIRNDIVKLQSQTISLISQLIGLPITQDEKVIARHDNARDSAQPIQVDGQTFFVSKKGKDSNDGLSIDAPKETIQGVINSLAKRKKAQATPVIPSKPTAKVKARKPSAPKTTKPSAKPSKVKKPTKKGGAIKHDKRKTGKNRNKA